VINLSKYDDAKAIGVRVANGDRILVRVLSGALEGTVARVVKVQFKNYERHDYWLEVDGRSKKWWHKGDTLEECDPHEATAYVENAGIVATYMDIMGQAITEGTVVAFARASRVNSGTIEMVLGTVRKVTQSGIMVLPFIVNNKQEIQKEEVRVAKPDKCLVMNKGTQSALMMAKMSAA
jgi:hypothetical protein